MDSPVGLLTLGHGRLNRSELLSLLHDASIRAVVDIRRFPGSRRDPDMSRERLAGWLPADAIDYRWDERLGGRRRLDRDVASADGWWRVESFRAYAAHTRTGEFRQAMGELVTQAAQERSAVMCSESVWWRCHRRLVADVATLTHGLRTAHLMPDGRISAHQPSDGARLDPSGEVFWDSGPAVHA